MTATLRKMQVGAERADRVWRAGDVCECEDAVGASLRGLGVACAGRLVPLPPGMHFKVLPRRARAGLKSHSQSLCSNHGVSLLSFAWAQWRGLAIKAALRRCHT